MSFKPNFTRKEDLEKAEPKKPEVKAVAEEAVAKKAATTAVAEGAVAKKAAATGSDAASPARALRYRATRWPMKCTSGLLIPTDHSVKIAKLSPYMEAQLKAGLIEVTDD
jgi:hypothetical protein